MAASECFVFETENLAAVQACFSDPSVIGDCVANVDDTKRRFACDCATRWPDAYTALLALPEGTVRIYTDAGTPWRDAESWVDPSFD